MKWASKHLVSFAPFGGCCDPVTNTRLTSGAIARDNNAAGSSGKWDAGNSIDLSPLHQMDRTVYFLFPFLFPALLSLSHSLVRNLLLERYNVAWTCQTLTFLTRSTFIFCNVLEHVSVWDGKSCFSIITEGLRLFSTWGSLRSKSSGNRHVFLRRPSRIVTAMDAVSSAGTVVRRTERLYLGSFSHMLISTTEFSKLW